MSEMARKFMDAFRDSVHRDSSIDASSREQLLRQVDQAYVDEPPPCLAFIGETGVGKSTTVNALFNAGQEVGHFKATTLSVEGLEVFATIDQVRGRRGDLKVIDMPGVGDDRANYDRYLQLYLENLPKADAILWIHPASDRMVAFVQQVVGDLVQAAPELDGRIVFGLNKADEMHPNDWNRYSNTPSANQVHNLEARVNEFAHSVKPYVRARQPQVVTYSALKRYNLASLFRMLMEAVPGPRRWVLESRMDLAAFIDLVDQRMLAAVQSRGSIDGDQVPSVPHQANRSRKPQTFEEYLLSLSEDEYRALTADRRRFLEAVEKWGGRA